MTYDGCINQKKPRDGTAKIDCGCYLINGLPVKMSKTVTSLNGADQESIFTGDNGVTYPNVDNEPSLPPGSKKIDCNSIVTVTNPSKGGGFSGTTGPNCNADIVQTVYDKCSEDQLKKLSSSLTKEASTFHYLVKFFSSNPSKFIYEAAFGKKVYQLSVVIKVSDDATGKIIVGDGFGNIVEYKAEEGSFSYKYGSGDRLQSIEGCFIDAKDLLTGSFDAIFVGDFLREE